jgi:hypothetical protein
VVKIPVDDPMMVPWVHGAIMLVANIALVIVTMIILNRTAKRVEGAPALKRIVAAER